jgi:hypothetical protein
MTIDFDFSNVNTVEFGVGKDNSHEQSFTCMAVDGNVQTALREMAEATWRAMDSVETSPANYEPSEKYERSEYLRVPLDDSLAENLRQFHNANNLPTDSTALSNPNKIYCYFARMTDRQDRRLSAIRRASQFKGALKSRFVRIATDALKLVEDKVFKLDNDFDILIDAKNVHILRPSSFEFVAKLQAAILAAVPINIKSVQRHLKFVDFSGIEQFAMKHPRAARYLASIRSQADIKNIDKNAFKKLCKETGVVVQNSNKKMTVDDSNVMGFLEVLDRRRYHLELVKGSAERFKAASRKKIDE